MDDKINAPGEKVTLNTIEPPQKTFFFERPDGSIVPTNEREAWDLIKTGPKIIGQRLLPYKLVGVSDGTKFHQAVMEAHQMFKEGKPMNEIQARMKQGEAEEFELAKGKIEMPRDFDVIDKNRNPVNLAALGSRIR